MAKLLESDVDGWARLRGLMAVLALPPVRTRAGFYRRAVEVELAPDVWQQVDSVAIEEHRVLFWFGPGEHRTQFQFLRSGGIPRWRQVEQSSTGVVP